MKTLNPTLWRTCRMLAGETRLKLLRELHDRPGRNITELAETVGISRSFASQEMRRIQSRGFLARTPRGKSMVYQPTPDPQVPSAAPLLKAVMTAMDAHPPRRDTDMAAIAAGLAHERRIGLARSLLQAPKTRADLQAEQPMAPCSFFLHLRTLAAGGFLQETDRLLTFTVPTHPLARALARLLRKEAGLSPVASTQRI